MDIGGVKKDINDKVAAMSTQLNKKKSQFKDARGAATDKLNSLTSTDFLLELTQGLIGTKALKDYVVDCITNRLPDIEDAIKEGLKKELKEKVCCGLNPSIPVWFRKGGAGVELKVTDIDFFNIMKTDPNTLAGGLIYTDIPSGVNSTDFNTYLYNTIQSPSISTNWVIPGTTSEILESTFVETGSAAGNNAVKYTTSTTYSTKTLPDFNNNFIDSLSLFGNPFSLDSSKVIALIMEELFGSVSSSPGINKSKKEIQKELEIKEVIDCILDSQNDDVSDDFFTFDNETLSKIDRDATNRRNCIRELETCGNLLVQVPATAVQAAVNLVTTATTTAQQTIAVTQALNDLADLQASFTSNPINGETVRTNFILEIIRKLQRIVMSSILTPEFMTLFAINHQILYGKGSSYNGPIDFLRKNCKLIKNIGKVVLNILLTLLLNLALLYLTIKLREKLADDQIEKAKNYVSILLSLTGAPPGIINQVREINTGVVPSTNLNVF